jgi:hypothetical protein
MATATAAIKLKFLLIPAIVTALLGTYFTALYIDSPAKEKAIFKRLVTFTRFDFNLSITSFSF